MRDAIADARRDLGAMPLSHLSEDDYVHPAYAEVDECCVGCGVAVPYEGSRICPRCPQDNSVLCPQCVTHVNEASISHLTHCPEHAMEWRVRLGRLSPADLAGKILGHLVVAGMPEAANFYALHFVRESLKARRAA